MKFIIWGIGLNSLDALDILGRRNVVAFIDSNKESVGKMHLYLPVISFEEYKNDIYRHFTIVVSPAKNKEIIDLLENQEIFNYLLLSEIAY